jgi:hypothetical protein
MSGILFVALRFTTYVLSMSGFSIFIQEKTRETHKNMDVTMYPPGGHIELEFTTGI